MSSLYPLKFKPIFKDKIWGGNKINTVLQKDFSPMPNCGELWALSGVQGDVSVIENGFLADNDLNEIIEIYMDELLGESVFKKYGNEFPVLIKFLNSKDPLSVQVHPDDAMAFKKHHCMGKTEMWYIIDNDVDSELIIGLKNDIDKESFVKELENGNIKNTLNHVKIAKEDVFFIPAGRVHAIGKGVLLAEIQQSSDITYRLYDWDRVDDKGNQRELHTDLAIEAIDFSPVDDYYTHYSRLKNIPAEVIKSPFFNVNNLIIEQNQTIDLAIRDSFTVYVCVEGKFKIAYNENDYHVSLGECVLIPADLNDFSIIPDKKAVLLEVFI